MPCIASFVFFDLETTGLLWQERNQTKITELSCVAALRQDIQSTFLGETPPVKKLTFVLNPQRPIDRVVTKMTGFTNDFLRHAPVFQQKVKSLISFLEDLPQPVCLVAHNGNNFDFKILLAECNDAVASLPKNLLCVDSLIGFRSILKGKNINYSSLKLSEQTLVNDLLTDDEDEWPEINVSLEDWEEIDEICLSLSDISCEDMSDTEKNTKITEQQKKKINDARSKAIRKVFGNKPKETVDKKQTNRCQTEVKVKQENKECFTLSAVYKRLLDKEDSNAHRAEVDCLMLAQCVVALKNDFLPWADGASKLLTDIKPLIRY